MVTTYRCKLGCKLKVAVIYIHTNHHQIKLQGVMITTSTSGIFAPVNERKSHNHQLPHVAEGQDQLAQAVGCTSQIQVAQGQGKGCSSPV